MTEQGVHLDLFEIGNEIDFGICGEFEEEWPKRVSLEYMQQRIWPRMTPILRRPRPVSEGRPNAKFVIHLAQWNKPDYCLAFWKEMRRAGVRVDLSRTQLLPDLVQGARRTIMGLPANPGRSHLVGTERAGPDLRDSLPATADFGGQFAEWKHPVTATAER